MSKPNVKQVLDSVREEFKRVIDQKNGWGKQEVLMVYDGAVTHVLFDLIDDREIETEGNCEGDRCTECGGRVDWHGPYHAPECSKRTKDVR